MYSEVAILKFAKAYTNRAVSVELLGESHNTVYKINCDRPFILRITSSTHRTQVDLLSELDFLLLLHDKGANVATPIPSRSNELVLKFSVEDQVLFVCAFTIADGLQWWERADHCYFEHIGRELGKIHKSSRIYNGTNGIYRRQYIENQHLIKAYDIFEKYDSKLHDTYKSFMEQLSRKPKNSVNFGLTHGDFLFSNYTITLDNKVSVYDFDECEYSWFISDIAICVYYYLIGGDPSRVSEKKEEAEITILNFMAGYLLENKLPAIELAQIDLFFKLRDWVLLSTIIGRGDTKGNDWNEKLITGALDRVLNNKPLVDIDMEMISKKCVSFNHKVFV